jgi:hypothetical protein
MVRVWIVNNIFRADERFKELLVHNSKGSPGAYKYAYVKRLRSGKYEVGLLQEKSVDTRITRQKLLGRVLKKPCKDDDFQNKDLDQFFKDAEEGCIGWRRQ